MSLTLLNAWNRSRHALEVAGVGTPVLDARALVEEAAGVQRIEILTDPYRELTPEQDARLAALTARRADREPLAYVLGRKEFWTLTLKVTPAVLTPRPETEFVVEMALAQIPATLPARVLDLGTGSGAILLAILSERPRASGVGVDASAAALQVAADNAAAHGLADRIAWREGDWAEGLDGPFDLIVSNPPYIPAAEIETLEPEVRREPSLALDGGPDGLGAYRRLVPEIARLLAPNGAFAVEVGRGQAGAVQTLADAAGLFVEGVKQDLAGVPRVVHGRKPS